MKKTKKIYHLKENIKRQLMELFFMIFLAMVGALAVVGLFAITKARIETIENNQIIIENNK